MSTIVGDIITIGSRSSEDSASEIYALINVTYPSGSVCTATNGTLTLTALDTSGHAIFWIPEPTSTPETWTVSCTDGTDSDSLTISISAYGQIEEIELVNRILNENSWNKISEIAQAGKGDLYWDVGDCKEIVLNGKIGADLTLTNLTLCVFILDFNHPINKSTADNNIIWGGFKTSIDNGIDVCLKLPSRYGASYSSGKYFNLNHVYTTASPGTFYNHGGWRCCDFRYDILGATSKAPSVYNKVKTDSVVGYDATEATITKPVANTLMSALPDDLRAVLRLWNRYIDYKGNCSNTDANCSTPTVDAISLLAEFEVMGSRTYANQYEQNHQKQMKYYTLGNQKRKYRYDSDSYYAMWWLASPDSSNSSKFCYYGQYGVESQHSACSIGLAPAFRI